MLKFLPQAKNVHIKTRDVINGDLVPKRPHQHGEPTKKL